MREIIFLAMLVACTRRDLASTGQIPWCTLAQQQVYVDLIRIEKPPVSDSTRDKHWTAVQQYYGCAFPEAFKK